MLTESFKRFGGGRPGAGIRTGSARDPRSFQARGRLKTVDESAAGDLDGVADLQDREIGHQLTGATLADAEDALDGPPVEVIGLKRAKLADDGGKASSDNGFRRHRA